VMAAEMLNVVSESQFGQLVLIGMLMSLQSFLQPSASMDYTAN
jgi:hypothetical protein